MQRIKTQEESASPELWSSVSPETQNLTANKQLCLDSAGPGGVFAQHYRSLRLVDFTATPLKEPGSERHTAVPPAAEVCWRPSVRSVRVCVCGGLTPDGTLQGDTQYNYRIWLAIARVLCQPLDY